MCVSFACSVLSCRYVDEVIIGAPLVITEDMMKTMNISVVVKGAHAYSLTAVLAR